MQRSWACCGFSLQQWAFPLCGSRGKSTPSFKPDFPCWQLINGVFPQHHLTRLQMPCVSHSPGREASAHFTNGIKWLKRGCNPKILMHLECVMLSLEQGPPNNRACAITCLFLSPESFGIVYGENCWGPLFYCSLPPQCFWTLKFKFDFWTII